MKIDITEESSINYPMNFFNNSVYYVFAWEEKKLDNTSQLNAISFDEKGDEGVVGTEMGTIWYVHWTEKSTIRLVSSHPFEICSLDVKENKIASSDSNGCVKVWDMDSNFD